MASLRLQIRTVPHGGPVTGGDDAEGERLVGWVREALAGGSAPPAAVVLRSERTEIVGLGSPSEAGIALPRFIASLTRSTVEDAGAPHAIAVIGTVQARRRGSDGPSAVPMAVVFVEWADNRWWYWRGLLADDGRSVRTDTEVVARAVDGDPMPELFGRWWSLARRANLGIHLSRVPSDEGGPGAHRVH